MSEVGSILERFKELATQAASGNSNADLAKIDAERADLTTEIDRIVNFTQYGGATLLNGSYGGVKLDTNTANTTAYLVGVRNIDVTNAKANESYTIDVRDADGDTGVDDITLTETSTGNSQSIMNVAGTVSGLAMNATADLDFSMLGVKITVDNRLVVSNGNGIDAGATNDIVTLNTAPSAKFQIGDKNNSDNQISFSLSTLATATLFGGAMSFSTMSGAQTALGTLDTAISTLATERGKIGGLLNRFSYAQSNLATSIENKTASESVIRDVDMAAEMSNFTKYQILVQAGTSMLAQANQAPQNVLSLLR
jgi:flagellin